MKLDLSQWKEFCFDDVFCFKRGRRLRTQDQTVGEVAYISSTKVNNGIDNYIQPPEYMVVYNNAITLNNSGSIGYCFYHAYDFVASDHCTIIKIKHNIELDVAIFLFLKPLIEAMKPKYGFAREMSDERLKKEKIILPATKKNGGYIPDWNYIKDYIKYQSCKVVYDKKIDRPHKTLDLASVKWEEFRYDELFEIKKGVRLTRVNMISGETPFIGSTDSNNGLTQRVGQTPIHKGNVITVNYNGSVGEAFYQAADFWASDDVNVLYPRENVFNTFNQYLAFFIIPLIKLEKYRYSYGRKWHKERMEKSIIRLPVVKSGELDLVFMENYIKSLPYSSNL